MLPVMDKSWAIFKLQINSYSCFTSVPTIFHLAVFCAEMVRYCRVLDSSFLTKMQAVITDNVIPISIYCSPLLQSREVPRIMLLLKARQSRFLVSHQPLYRFWGGQAVIDYVYVCCTSRWLARASASLYYATAISHSPPKPFYWQPHPCSSYVMVHDNQLEPTLSRIFFNDTTITST